MKNPAQRLPDITAHSSAVDGAALAAISRGNASVERELITLFRRLNDEDVKMLHEAVNDGDMAGALHASHRISGASGMIGAIWLKAVCERIEAASRTSDLCAVKENMSALRQEVERVYAFFDSV